MDIQPQSTQPISDDQELAKVLAGVNADPASETTDEAAPVETTPAGPPPATTPAIAGDDSTTNPSGETPEPAAADAPAPETPPMPVAPAADGGELSSVKQEAIVELRPLVDKLSLAPEEKFNTYLLLIRSTDDKTLIAPAHEAAKAITDETKRAEALLEIIKEIDFLSGSGQQPAEA